MVMRYFWKKTPLLPEKLEYRNVSMKKPLPHYRAAAEI